MVNVSDQFEFDQTNTKLAGKCLVIGCYHKHCMKRLVFCLYVEILCLYSICAYLKFKANSLKESKLVKEKLPSYSVKAALKCYQMLIIN